VAIGGYAAVLWDGIAALVPVPVGNRGIVGSGDPGFQSVGAGRGQAGWAALAPPGRAGAGDRVGTCQSAVDTEPGDR
jgi:hypothetical protein